MKKHIISIISLLFLHNFLLSRIIYADDIQTLLGYDYETFVSQLGEQIKDPKFLALLKTGDGDKDKINFEFNRSYRVRDLIPTQNEIDIEKSLKYPLVYEKSSVLESYMTPADCDVFAPGGTPIITTGGKYIIDGHHRWSQLYLINPDARIRAINMRIDDPIKALKITQLAIASITQNIPSAVVKGQNLLVINKDDFIKWVSDNIGPNALSVYSQLGFTTKDQVAEKIWTAAQQMRSFNAPIEGAPNRGLMPQTDSATCPNPPTTTCKNWFTPLENGELDLVK